MAKYRRMSGVRPQSFRDLETPPHWVRPSAQALSHFDWLDIQASLDCGPVQLRPQEIWVLSSVTLNGESPSGTWFPS